MVEKMAGKKITTFLIGLAFLMASCAVKEPAAQTQSSNGGTAATTNQNTNPRDSSDRNSGNKKEIDYYAHLRPEHREVLKRWLAGKAYLRPAVEEIDNTMFQEKYYADKEKYKEAFEENMKFLRETVGENGYQYYSVGDMSRDGKEDFAVLLVDTCKQAGDNDCFALAIFNGPMKIGNVPAYYEENLSGISNSYIVFDKMSKRHLFLGKLESDVYCATYYPKGRTYYFKDCME